MDVLVAVDDSQAARDALEFALETYPEANISVVTVLEVTTMDLGDNNDSPVDKARDTANETLTTAVEIADQYDRDVRTEILSGQTAKAIVSYAEDRDIDQIVVGSRGASGLKRLLLGSVAESVVRRAPCPVTIVR